jgi:transcriptional regulator with XRE-family HTH domain
MESKGITRAKIASSSGLAKSYVTELLHSEEDKRKPIVMMDTLDKIAKVLGTRGWVLWREAEKEAEGK